MKIFHIKNAWTDRKGERGQSLVEFALMAPIIILLFMGMVDFGWLLHQQIQMDNATRDAARRGAVGVDNLEITSELISSISFPINETDVTIEVTGPDGTVLLDSEDRTPDNLIMVSVDRINVQLITPLGGLLDGFYTIDQHSEAEFLIE